MYKKLAIQTIIYAVGSILPKIVNYIFLKFFTISLKVGEFSLYADMYSLSFLVIGILSLGLENTYFRFLYKKDCDKETVFSTSVIIQFIINLLFFIIFLTSIDNLSYILGYYNHKEYFLMFSIIIFFDTICILPMAWLRANNRPLRHTIVNSTIIFIQSFFITYMFLCYKNSCIYKKNYFFFVYEIVNSFTDRTGYIFFANTLSSLCNFFLVLPILLKKVNIKKFDILFVKKMLSYSLPIMIVSISFSVNENLDKIIIKRWGSDEINGAYSACYKIASFMNLYVKTFRLGIEPFFFRKSKDINAKYYYEEIIYLFILLGLIFYVLICGNISLFINFLIDKKYHIAISIIPVIMMGNLLLGIYTNMSIFYKILDKPIIGTYISFIGLLITLLFNLFFIFISNKNFMIPSWGTLISYGCMLIILYSWSKKKFLEFFRKINNIIIHFLFAIFIVFITYENKIGINLLLQIFYIIIVFLLEKKRLLNLFK
ncbi:lipopolysaccharide biosynthesis protein [Blattabacterium cuenoti]|uniref:lipopolysaccharide biosynthesis protein n=1 Tax=Blattabacterium cuenoti TaxID=1653831 RepID=UPI00163CF76A|nr:oligosaccharide flippase family protein [Blattabacterium cuenoti]